MHTYIHCCFISLTYTLCLSLIHTHTHTHTVHTHTVAGCVSTRCFFVRTLLMPASKTHTWLALLLHHFALAPTHHCWVMFQHLGGACADVPATRTSFHPRHAEWSLVIGGVWVVAGVANDDATLARTWVMRTVIALMPFSLGVYPTDLGPDDLELARYCYGENMTRLLDLKRKWDPTNMFGRGFPLLSLSPTDSPISLSPTSARL